MLSGPQRRCDSDPLVQEAGVEFVDQYRCDAIGNRPGCCHDGSYATGKQAARYADEFVASLNIEPAAFAAAEDRKMCVHPEFQCVPGAEGAAIGQDESGAFRRAVIEARVAAYMQQIAMFERATDERTGDFWPKEGLCPETSRHAFRLYPCIAQVAEGIA